MKTHNLLEDIVRKEVEEIFSDTALMEKLNICTCDQCKLDIMCYALNRLPPRYIISGKGAVHIEAEFSDDYQNVTDIVSIINEGIQKVKETKRPSCSQSSQERSISGPVYNFPNITGRVFHGETFEPIHNIDVTLLSDGRPVEMISSNWLNPYRIIANTAGVYNFWPSPIPANNEGSKKFQFQLLFSGESIEETSHHFSIEQRPEGGVNEIFDLKSSHKIEDIYIFDR